MIKTLLFAVIGLALGAGTGIGAKVLLAPGAEAAADADHASEDDHGEEGGEDAVVYAEFESQFIIPLVNHRGPEKIVIASINLEVSEAILDTVHANEPKLRALFLQALFNHANNGGFDESYTNFGTLQGLKRELLTLAQNTVGPEVYDVLFLDLIRQTR